MGRVEVCVNEQYGTVCDQGFDRSSAAVVCGQLGYSRISKLKNTVMTNELANEDAQANVYNCEA